MVNVQLRDLYNVTGYQALETSGSIIAFGSFLSQTARYADLAKYEQKNKLPGRNFTIISINGAPDNQVNNGQHGEANLDVQNIVGVTSGQLPVVQCENCLVFSMNDMLMTVQI